MKKLTQNIMTKTAKAGLLALGLFSFVACEDDFQSPANPEGVTITDIIAGSEDHDVLEAALVMTDLVKVYSNINSGTYTVFAPNDAAMLAFVQTTFSLAALPTEQDAIFRINQLTATSAPLSLPQLAARLNYHVFTSELKAADIVGAQTFATVNTARLSLSKVGSSVLINTGMGNSGGTVLAADLDATNGVVHSIDKVLAVPSTSTTTLEVFSGMSVNYTLADPIVGGTAANADANGADFDLLAYTLRLTGLATTLVPNATIRPDFTVFAPTDAAFLAYLGVATEAEGMTALAAVNVQTLTNLIKYHVLAGRYLSTDLSNNLSLTTAFTGNNLTVSIDTTPDPDVVSLVDGNNGQPNATVTGVNNIRANGVVHTINAVLRPN
ncbi:MAG: fasciclin domain-containing protein [Cyclobacteriaceae bacterium]|nr:fasciclin domain-containing protein [Cyclobacteriaceae bacterium]